MKIAVSGHHGEELLVAVRLVLLVVGLVMLLDHLVAGVSGHGIDAERPDVGSRPRDRLVRARIRAKRVFNALVLATDGLQSFGSAEFVPMDGTSPEPGGEPRKADDETTQESLRAQPPAR